MADDVVEAFGRRRAASGARAVSSSSAAKSNKSGGRLPPSRLDGPAVTLRSSSRFGRRRTAGETTRIPSSVSCLAGDRAGSTRHEVRARLGLRIGDDLADVVLACEEGHKSVKADGKATMGRSAVTEGAEEESETGLGIFLGIPRAVKTRLWMSALWILMLPDPSSQPLRTRS